MYYLRAVYTVVLTLIVTVVSVFAFDYVTGPRAMLSTCVLGTALTMVDDRRWCVDQYEASPGPGCPVLAPMSTDDTARNLVAAACKPVSTAGELPWRHVSYIQAHQLCAQVGKQLLDTAQWSTIASGVTGLEDCHLSSKTSGPLPTGSSASCVTPAGVYDLVGNVWEWVTYEGGEDGLDTTLPPSGYVAGWTSWGVPSASATTSEISFGDDYLFTTSGLPVVAVLRGGFYNSGSDGGVYAWQSTLRPTDSTAATGFRCVYELPTTVD